MLIIGNHYHLVPVVESHYWRRGKRPHQIGHLSFALSFLNSYDEFIALCNVLQGHCIHQKCPHPKVRSRDVAVAGCQCDPSLLLASFTVLQQHRLDFNITFFLGQNRGCHRCADRYTDISFCLPPTALLLPLPVLTRTTQSSITMVMGANWMAEV